MRKFIISLLAVLSLVAVTLFWENNLLLVILLLIIGALMLLVNKSKTELTIFLYCGFLGAIAEVIAVYSGAWEYSNNSFLGIPIWLPILWAIASIFILRIAGFIKLRT